MDKGFTIEKRTVESTQIMDTPNCSECGGWILQNCSERQRMENIFSECLICSKFKCPFNFDGWNNFCVPDGVTRREYLEKIINEAVKFGCDALIITELRERCKS